MKFLSFISALMIMVFHAPMALADDAFEKLVDEYFTVIEHPDPQEMLDNHIQATIKVMKQTNQSVNEAEIMNQAKEQMLPVFEQSHKSTKQAYMDVYTLEELAKLLEFYKTDLGQMHLKKNKLVKARILEKSLEQMEFK